MYSLHSAHVRVDRRNDRWEKKDLANTTLLSLRNDYDEIWLFIDHYSFDAPERCTLGTSFNKRTTTLTNSHSPSGCRRLNQTLPFRATVPRLDPSYVK